jgi:DNA-directed RNA polymerase specialized sigma24 family protein
VGQAELSTTVQANARAEALAALSEDQRKHLVAYAVLKAQNTGEEGTDLLHSAFERWLTSSEPVAGPDRTYDFLIGAINSLRSNIFRHAKVVRAAHGTRAMRDDETGHDPINDAPELGQAAEASVFCQQLYDLCAGDDDMQLLLMAQWDFATRAEIQSELGWDDTKYETVMTRKRRLVARWKVEGKL